MRKIGSQIAVTVLLAATVAGCAKTNTDPAMGPAPEVNFLAGCGPLPDATIAKAVQLDSVRQQSSPTICAWEGHTPDNTGPVDITYAWLETDTLGRESALATQLGYRTEHLVIKHFGGLAWHDPRDPGSCAVTIADSGTVTWWVQNRGGTLQPDPCAAALELAKETLAIDGV